MTVMWYSLGSMSKTKKRTIALSAALLVVAAGLVVAVRMQHRSAQAPVSSAIVDDGPYRLVASESQASVKLFGQKAGWIAIQFPVESSLVVARGAMLETTTALRWSQAQVAPESYRATLLEMFRPGRALENRFEFLLSQIPIPSVGSVTDVTVPAQILLYGQQKDRPMDVVVSMTSDRLKVASKTLVTMDLTDFRADNLANLLAVQSGAKVSKLFELRFELVYESNTSTPAKL